jgi:hypothetical protein
MHPHPPRRRGIFSAVKPGDAEPHNENEDQPLVFTFEAELFEWTSSATSWFFVRMPADQSQELREQMDGLTNGFGSIRVEVSLGESVWLTSVFPDSATKCYVLPVKKAIRKHEELEPGDPTTVTIRVVSIDSSSA